MATRVPTVEIVIRDEVSAGMERMRQRMRAESGREWFKGMESGFASAGRAAQRLHNELGNLVRLTGAGVFLGGGFIAGLTKLTESLGNLSRETLQMNATAASIGLTVKQFDMLIARGQAVGLSAEQAKGQIGGLAKIIDELAVKGVKAGRFAEIYKSIGGPEFLQRVRRATLSGGTQAGIEEYIRGMSRVVDRRGRTFVADFAGMSPAWSKALQVDEKALVDSIHVPEEEAQKLNLELVKLQITLENVKKTAAVAVLPAMTELVKAFDKFVQGPGAAVVKQFGEWLASLNIDWKAVTAGIVSITEALTKFFQGLDPIVQQIGGWKTIIGGLVGAATLGLLVTRLGAIGSALLGIGAAAFVVPLLGAGAMFAGSGTAAGGAAGVQGAPGGPSGPAVRGPGGGKPASPQPQPPAPNPAPYGRDRRGRAYPAPQNQQRSDLGDLDPENAAPYRVAGGWQPPPGYLKAGDTEELRTTVSNVTENVTRLAQNIAALGLNTDASGAGPMAGVAGRVTSGGGGYRGGGGGSSSRSARTASSSGSSRTGPTGPQRTEEDKTPPRAANVRFNNPGAMYPGQAASMFSTTGTAIIGGGHKIAGFPTPVHGAAANMENLRLFYAGMTISQAMRKWSGGYRDVPGPSGQRYDPSMRITQEMLSDPAFMIPFFKALTSGEAKGRYPMDQRQWEQAFRWYRNKGVPEGETALTREKTDPRLNPPPSPNQNPPANPNVAPANPKITPANPQPNTAGTNDEGPEFRTARNSEVGTYVGFERAIQGLSPEMQARVMAAWKDMPPEVRKSFVINEGWRSYEYQAYLKRTQRSHGRGPVASPGGSRHEGGGEYGEGGAIDVDRGPALDWLHRYGHRYGLEGIGKGDYPHIQLSRRYRGPQFYDPNNPQRIPLPGQAGEKARQAQAQQDFDEYLAKQKQNEAERPSFAARARAGRLKVNINLRGPRGVKSAIRDSSGGVSTTINREMDPTGGGQIQSPA